MMQCVVKQIVRDYCVPSVSLAMDLQCFHTTKSVQNAPTVGTVGCCIPTVTFYNFQSELLMSQMLKTLAHSMVQTDNNNLHTVERSNKTSDVGFNHINHCYFVRCVLCTLLIHVFMHLSC